MTALELQSKRLRTGSLAFAAGLVAAMLLLVVLPLDLRTRGTLDTFLFCAAPAAAAAAAWLGFSVVRGQDRRLLLYLAVALSLMTVGASYRFLHYLATGRGSAGPNPADLAYLTAMVFLVPISVAMGNPARLHRLRRLASLVDLAIVVTLAAPVLWIALVHPTLAGLLVASAPDSYRQLAYVSFVLALALFPFAFRQETWSVWASWFVASLCTVFLYVLGVLVLKGAGALVVGTRAVVAVDALFLAAALMAGMSAVWRMTAAPGEIQGPAPLRGATRWTAIVVPVLELAGLPIAIAIAVMSRDQATEIIAGTAAFVAAVLLGAHGLISATERRVLDDQEGAALGYRTLVEDAPMSIIVIDPHGIVLFANDAAAATLGAGSPYDLMGIDVSTLLPSPGAVMKEEAEIEALIAALMREPGKRHRSTVRLTRMRSMSGEIIAVERSAAAIFYEGEPAVLIQGQDVSARVKAEHELILYRDRLQALAADLVGTEERERRSLAQSLHDFVGQPLAVARMRMKAAAASNDMAGEDAAIAIEMIDQAISETRSLTTELAPPILYELGLERALWWLCSEMETTHGLRCEIEGTLDDADLTEERRTALFRSVRELLINSAKHAGNSKVDLSLVTSPRFVEIVVTDHGKGFDSGATSGSSTAFGLFSIRERLSQIGGKLTIDTAPGEGVRASIVMPRGDARRPY